MHVRDAMAPDVSTLDPDDSVVDAARLMGTAGTGFLPVTQAGRPVGVLTDRDIVVRLVAGGDADPATVPVSEVMTTKVTVIGPDDDLPAAAAAMRDAGVRRLVVVEDDAVVGVLSHGALVQATRGEGAGREATLGVTAGA